uniref:Uncharacterized protein n=1 Tax=Vespula pensylvanica TaxID=30213 RepID=A0A834N0R6_VESPE|nr:hypothetical protein H0235_017459 [Vespula pensylvanica]
MREQLKFYVTTRKLRQPINDKQEAKAEQCSYKNFPIPDYSILYTLHRVGLAFSAKYLGNILGRMHAYKFMKIVSHEVSKDRILSDESSVGKNQNNEKVNPLNNEETRLDIKCSHNTMRKYYDKYHQKPRKYKEDAYIYASGEGFGNTDAHVHPMKIISMAYERICTDAVQNKLQKLTIEEISLIYHRPLAECLPTSFKNNRFEIFLNLSISELEMATIAALLYPLFKKK